MRTMTVRINPDTYRVLQELAQEQGESLSDTLDRLVEGHRRWRILQQANEAYATAAADPEAAAEWASEIAAWDATVADGLEDYPGR